MKKLEYKFWYIRRNDDGFITDCAIRFFEGEYDSKGKFSRTLRLQANDLKHFSKERGGKKQLYYITEASGGDCVYYDSRDFGSIKTDSELCIFLNNEIKKDKGREPINEQKV